MSRSIRDDRAGAHLQLVASPVPGLAGAIAGAVRGGIDSVQVRDHAASPRELCALARDAAAVCGGRAGVFVNGHAEVARAAGASGAHLRSFGLAVAAARMVLTAGQQVGVSVHSVAEAITAARAGADYLLFGHVYPTASHRGEPGRGADALREVVDAVKVPVLAIGGIDAGRVSETMSTGCAGVAVIGAILGRDDPERATRSLRLALDACPDPKRIFHAAATFDPRCETLEP